MDAITSLLKFLDTPMTRPEMFGWFHLLWLGITAAATVLLCRFGKPKSQSAVYKTIFVTAIVILLFEIYKQINYTFIVKDGAIVTKYQWYAFPFQFCSMPMYVQLLCIFIKKGRVRQALCAFLATYGLFAGLAVMLYPSTVFIQTIGINIQTMICHGSMVAIGIYLLCSSEIKLSLRTMYQASAVFAIALGIAVLLNEIAYRVGIVETGTFNMFFVSPYCEPSLPVYSIVQNHVPFPFCLVLYFIGFTGVSTILMLIAMLVKRLAEKKKKAVAADAV